MRHSSGSPHPPGRAADVARRMASSCAAVVFAAAITPVTTMAVHADDDKLRALGRRLAGECTSCHRPDAMGGSIPSITGWKIDDFLTTLHFYAKGERTHAPMMSVAQSLDETQMRALALYFGSLAQPKKPAGPPGN